MRELYLVARQEQAHTLANEILEISDAPVPTFSNAAGVVRTESAGVQRTTFFTIDNLATQANVNDAPG